jgi:hypothetical protein
MSKYIDAEKLIAEIDRRMTENCKLAEKAKCFGDRAVEDNDILALIEHFQQEQPHKTFCEENCKGYRDTGGKCFFGFNCSAKKAQEQPKVDFEKELNKLISLEYENQANDDEWDMCIARHFYDLGRDARKKE